MILRNKEVLIIANIIFHINILDAIIQSTGYPTNSHFYITDI